MAVISPTKAGRMGVARPPRKLRGFRVYGDESNTDGSKPHPVYGAILVSLDHVQEVQREIRDWRVREDMHRELKWKKVAGGLRLKKYKSFVDLLFNLSKQRGLMHFKAIILDKRSPQYRTYSKGDDELGFYKFYYHWLLRYFAPLAIQHQCHLRVIIDDRPVKGDPYAVLKIILNRAIRRDLGATTDVVTKVEAVKSHLSDLLQAADVLMGAIGFHNQDFHLRPDANREKVELARYIARKAGVRDLKHETNQIKETFKIVRWYWGPRPSLRKHPRSRRPSSE